MDFSNVPGKETINRIMEVLNEKKKSSCKKKRKEGQKKKKKNCKSQETE